MGVFFDALMNRGLFLTALWTGHLSWIGMMLIVLSGCSAAIDRPPI
jgi:hypothetical protein